VSAMKLTIDIFPGELADRISILQLRIEHVQQTPQRQQLMEELQELRQAWETLPPPANPVGSLVVELSAVNAQLWDVEDQLRLHESRGDFGGSFVELARSVYRLNDDRSRLKRQINLCLCGRPGEEKVHLAAGDFKGKPTHATQTHNP
jgi:hypothetical protein